MTVDIYGPSLGGLPDSSLYASLRHSLGYYSLWDSLYDSAGALVCDTLLWDLLRGSLYDSLQSSLSSLRNLLRVSLWVSLWGPHER